MSQITINGSRPGSDLMRLLNSESITPGDVPSYELCKVIYETHILGAKLTDAPVTKAQSQKRKIIAGEEGIEDRLVEAFMEEAEKLRTDQAIWDLMSVSRRYGAGALGLLDDKNDPGAPVDWTDLWKREIAFNVWDPLNTAGSLVLNQIPTSMDFLKQTDLTVTGTTYHRSRSLVKFNERPIYLGWTTSAFGYVGRSVYQRALYPLKSFVQSMLTDDLVVVKSGVLIAALEQAGAIVDNVMQWMFGTKRQVVKEATTGNVISISPNEKIETLNMQNLDGAYGLARTNILKNIATAADMPAIMLENETLVGGFGEGSEDAKQIAQYIDRIRLEMAPLYAWMDKVVMHRAWNPEFYKALQNDMPELASVPYETAFIGWRNSFKAEWPNLLEEPDSEKSKTQDVMLKALIAVVQVLLPEMDPTNKAIVFGFLTDNLNQLPLLFPAGLELDLKALEAHASEQAEQAKALAQPGGEQGEPAAPPPFSQRDSDIVAKRLIGDLNRKLRSLPRAA